jgi:hypothetical protein
MLSENTVITQDQYYNNTNTYIDETGTLPQLGMNGSSSVSLLAIPTKAQSIENRRRNKNKTSKNIKRLIRRMEKAKYDAKHRNTITPFHPPPSQPDPSNYGKHLERSTFMQSRPDLCCAALINARDRTYSVETANGRRRSDSNASDISEISVNDNNKQRQTKSRGNQAVQVTSPLYRRRLKKISVRNADGTITKIKAPTSHEKFDVKLSPRNASLRHNIKHLPKKPLTVPRRHINIKTLNHKEEQQPFVRIFIKTSCIQCHAYIYVYTHKYK